MQSLIFFLGKKCYFKEKLERFFLVSFPPLHPSPQISHFQQEDTGVSIVQERVGEWLSVRKQLNHYSE